MKNAKIRENIFASQRTILKERKDIQKEIPRIGYLTSRVMNIIHMMMRMTILEMSSSWKLEGKVS